jgi:hypothetical protein
MGCISEDGTFVYTPGFGSGRFGMPYDANTPQGEYHLGSLEARPFWARHPMTRRLTFLLYMERRAFQSLRRQPGSYIERIVNCTERLQARHAKKWGANENDKNDSGYFRRKRWLEATKEFPKFLEKVVEDFYPSGEYPDSWDYGQTTHRVGLEKESKIQVKQLLQAINKIGYARFPGPLHGTEVANDPLYSEEWFATKLDESEVSADNSPIY